MSAFSGRFRYLESAGSPPVEGSCKLAIQGDGFVLTPDSGPPLACDFGDVDLFSPGEYELSLTLYTGSTLLLTHFGKTFQNLHHDMLEAYRSRMIRCLLLEDLEEVARFDGWAQLDSAAGGFSSRSEIRLYRSNLAILPETAAGFSWRFADIDSVDFDEATYTLGVRSGPDRLILTRLAKRTDELIRRLREGIAAVGETGAKIVRDFFPFLTPDELRRAVALFKEGRAVAMDRLCAIHPAIKDSLLSRAVDRGLQEYLESLLGMAADGTYYTGFKEIRQEGEAEGAEAGGGGRDEEADDDGTEHAEAEGALLHWFFVPLKAGPAPANVVAWEASSGSGRATYFFRLLPPETAAVLQDKSSAPAAVSEAILQLNRAIVTLNFRREPIYLSDEALRTRERFRRHAIACRRMPVLRRLRASFLGRALHTSPEAWLKQVRAILESS